MVRQGLVKALGKGAADAMVLTGHERMAGKVTSLSMISQGLLQQKKLVAALKRERCFRGANNIALSMISTIAQTRHHARYSVIYREAAAAHSFFVLARGSLGFTTMQDGAPEVLTVGEGDEMVCFGAEGLTGKDAGMRRLKTATCLSNCEVLHFTSFRMRLSEAGAEQYARRAFASFVEAELQKMPLFFGLKSTALLEISAMFELRECEAAGTEIFRPGDDANAMFVLAKGRVVLEDADGSMLSKLQAGSVEDGYPFFGERSILEGGDFATSATTRTPCKATSSTRSTNLRESRSRRRSMRS